MKWISRLCIPLMLLFLLSSLMISASASEAVKWENEISLPDDFGFQERNSCSGHTYFHQAAACENGMFLTCAHHIDSDEPTKLTFKRQYIDLYNRDGSFCKEFSFCTTQDYAAELTSTHIILYFYSYLITIDLSSGELCCYDQPDVHVADNKAIEYLRQDKFTSGQWQYVCKRSLTGYTELIRTSGEETQNLVSYGETEITILDIIIPLLFLGGILFVALKCRVRKKS